MEANGDYMKEAMNEIKNALAVGSNVDRGEKEEVFHQSARNLLASGTESKSLDLIEGKVDAIEGNMKEMDGSIKAVEGDVKEMKDMMMQIMRR